ncbi:hypothetical protein BS17DRAFT_820622 [Gyrodon lividus]|nr:hypothetical protein BS17DRAFT_820622 [Gyrodon lividus]
MGAKEANCSDPAVRTSIVQTQTRAQPAHSHTDNAVQFQTERSHQVKALELMKQALESQKNITEQIAHLAEQSERWQTQMVHLSPLEALLDLVQEGNAILHRRLQRQEEVMATQEWDL